MQKFPPILSQAIFPLALGLLALGSALLLVLDEDKPNKFAHAKGKPNRLAKESSPYLLLHAHNPVDWYPWGPEAFEIAKKENKLVFLSIGYSSCYWCHVMERQSFQNEEIAKQMNEHFINIKVDREERPDVDAIYMGALHVQGRQGGWPLSMFLLPDGTPVVGGTYWPPEDRQIQGQSVPGFKSILDTMKDNWAKDPTALKEYGGRVAEAVKANLASTGRGPALVKLERGLIGAAVNDIAEDYDPIHAGFGRSEIQFTGPKFPTPSAPELLLSEYESSKNEKHWKMVAHTLERMSMGGIYDHIGGGFHRYSVDREWKVPHFEKMLYDNAQLVSLYSRAHALKPNPLYERVVVESLEYIAREMTSPSGGFYAALDAETEAEEGKFYVWTSKEIEAVLSKVEAELAKRVYGLNDGPNFEGKHNVLLLNKPFNEIATIAGLQPDELAEKLKPIKGKLLEARNKRSRPLLDTKILTGWNGLMIAGYADAARVFKNEEYARIAARSADFILTNVRTKDGRLLHTFSHLEDGAGEAKINAFLEDYAYFIHGLLALHQTTAEDRWLTAAKHLADQMLEHYEDKEVGGFFFTAHDHEKLFVRAKDQYDGATPSGNSLAAICLVRLAKITGENKYGESAEKTFTTFAAKLNRSPRSMTALARGLSMWLEE